MSDYPLPDPRTNPVAAIVLSYKTWKGIDFDNREWDSAHWPRSSKASKLLLDICGGFPLAERCLSELVKEFTEAGFNWTLETVTKHAHEWVQKNGRGSGTNARKRLFDAIAKRRSDERAASSGELTAGREILPAVRDLVLLQDSEQDDKAGTGSSDGTMLPGMDGEPRQRQSGDGPIVSREDSQVG